MCVVCLSINVCMSVCGFLSVCVCVVCESESECVCVWGGGGEM